MFWRALKNTLVYTAISMVLILLFARVLAGILLADIRKRLLRFLVLLPWVTPVALSTIAEVDAGLGVLADRLDVAKARAARGQPLARRPNLAMISVIAVHVGGSRRSPPSSSWLG